MTYRIEHDAMGDVRVPADRYWAAQTQRSVENFRIGVGVETMPPEIIHAFGLLKTAAARANRARRELRAHCGARDGGDRSHGLQGDGTAEQ